MKKQLAILVLALGLMTSFSAVAQQKIGHINADELLQMMPETKTAQQQLETYGRQLEKDLKDMETELQTKVQSFRENQKVMTELARENKSREIQELQLRIQEYSQRPRKTFSKSRWNYLLPSLKKLPMPFRTWPRKTVSLTSWTAHPAKL